MERAPTRRGFVRDRRGAAAIEFALIGGFLAVSIVIMADLAIATQQRMALDEALAAGAPRAAAGADDAAVRAAVEAALAANFTVGTGAGEVAVAVVRTCACTEALDTAVACGAACDAGAAPARFVDLAARRVYDGMLIGALGVDVALRAPAQ